jgi:hypothetical protein
LEKWLSSKTDRLLNIFVPLPICKVVVYHLYVNNNGVFSVTHEEADKIVTLLGNIAKTT